MRFLLPPPNGEDCVIASVRLFVSLSVSNSTENGFSKRIFMGFSGQMGLSTGNNLEYFGAGGGGAEFNPLDRGGFFSMFSWKSVSAGIITGKLMNGFSWNLQQKWNTRQETIYNIFGMLWLSPWNRRRSLYLRDTCLLVISWKTGEWIFMIFFYKKRSGTYMKKLTRLFHTWLDCFTVSHLGASDVSVCNIPVKWINGFSWNVQDKPGMAQGTFRGWGDRTLGYRVYFSIFWVGVCQENYGITGGSSWYFQDMDTRNNWLDCFTPD